MNYILIINMNKSQNIGLSEKTNIAEWSIEDDTATIKSKNGKQYYVIYGMNIFMGFIYEVENTKVCLGIKTVEL